jgi:hypothetical protein
MKKLVSAVLAVGFLFAVSIAAQAQVSATDLNGIKISGTANVTFLGYQSSYNNKGVASNWETDTTQSKEQAEYRIELYFDKTFSNGGSARLRLRGGASDAGTAALGQFRGNINDQNFAPNDQIFVKELYYTHPIPVSFLGKSTIRIGKMGTPTSGNAVGGLAIGSFFTDDATADGAQAVDQNPYGLQLDLNPISLVGITYAYLTQDHSNTDQNFSENSYHVIMLNFKPIANGNFRVGYWYSDKRYPVAEIYSEETYPGSDQYRYYRNDGQNERSLWTENPNGLFISIDQKIPNIDITPFVRYGQRMDRTVYGSGGYADGATGPATGSNAIGKAKQDIQIGAKIGGSFWGREKDHIFIAFGIAYYQTDAVSESSLIAGNKAIVGVDDTKTGADRYITEDIKPENHFEVNYSLSVNEGITIIPFVQYTWDIYRRGSTYRGQLGPDREKFTYSVVDASAYAAGIRTAIKF